MSWRRMLPSRTICIHLAICSNTCARTLKEEPSFALLSQSRARCPASDPPGPRWCGLPSRK
eukprot:7214012-Pyramimonas_sp.AAC.1